VTLSTTTLSRPVSTTAGEVRLTSTSGLLTGTRLYAGRELMSVVRVGVDSWVNVQRGVDGTVAQDHEDGETVTIGRADQFYADDPVGVPPATIPVSPRINIRNGAIWFARGDGPRWWQKQTATYTKGALGVQSVSYDPTESQ